MKLLNIESSTRPYENKAAKSFLILSTVVDGVFKLFCYFEGVAQGTSSVFIKDNYLKHADIIEVFGTPADAIESAFKHLGSEGDIYSWFTRYSSECLTQHIPTDQVNEYMKRLSSIKHLIGEITGYGNMDNVSMQVALELAGMEGIGYTYRHTPALSPTTVDYVVEETEVLKGLTEFYIGMKEKES